MFFAMELPNFHSQANTPIAKLWVFIVAKLATQNSFARKLSSTQVAAGHLSMRRPPMMQLDCSKIDHYQNAIEPKFDVAHAIHILATSSKAKVMTSQQISAGVSTLSQ
jgi:hypothetical protein